MGLTLSEYGLENKTTGRKAFGDLCFLVNGVVTSVHLRASQTGAQHAAHPHTTPVASNWNLAMFCYIVRHPYLRVWASSHLLAG